MNGTACPLCASTRTRVFLERRDVPVHQNRVFDTEAQARAARRGDLTMVTCGSCGFAFNASFDPARIEYDEGYDNCQICSPYFEQYVDALVSRIAARIGSGKRILEIGCGKGYFLRKLVESDPRHEGIGFDTSYEGPATDAGGRLQFRREFFGGEPIHPAPDVIVCRHVIEHVPAPAAMLEAVRAALPHQSNAQVFFETPSLEWILEHQVIWDIFYEHCSLFTAGSLARAFRVAGFAVNHVDRVFEGQYLWLEARPAERLDGIRGDTIDAMRVQEQCVAFGDRLRRSIGDWRARLSSAPRRRAVWGAGAKGVTFLNLVDGDRELFDCVVDLNPRKQGKFVPGTGHPIVAPEDLGRRDVREAILMNPNYEAENRAILSALGLQLELVCG